MSNRLEANRDGILAAIDAYKGEPDAKTMAELYDWMKELFAPPKKFPRYLWHRGYKFKRTKKNWWVLCEDDKWLKCPNPLDESNWVKEQ